MAYNPNVPEPDNLVQDDIAAMRENFQHLDPLAQAVGELQTVSGLAQITDDLQVVSALAPYVQALLDSRIVDHNLDVLNPPNGWYVRWENGLQVCFVTVNTVGVPYTTAVGPLYARDQDYNWTFPSAFASTPIVIGLTERSFDNRRSFIALTTVSSTSVTFRPILTVQETGSLLAVYANLCAIGWWKNGGLF